MKKNVYHGIILDAEFIDSSYPEKFKIFAKRKSSDEDWTLYGIEVEEKDLKKTIVAIQKCMKLDQPYYAHFYNDNKLIVIFKDKIFHVSPHISTWNKIIEYGKKLKIPTEQLDFWPNRFQDEAHYFEPEHFT